MTTPRDDRPDETQAPPVNPQPDMPPSPQEPVNTAPPQPWPSPQGTPPTYQAPAEDADQPEETGDVVRPPDEESLGEEQRRQEFAAQMRFIQGAQGAMRRGRRPDERFVEMVVEERVGSAPRGTAERGAVNDFIAGLLTENALLRTALATAMADRHIFLRIHEGDVRRTERGELSLTREDDGHLLIEYRHPGPAAPSEPYQGPPPAVVEPPPLEPAPLLPPPLV